MVTTANVKFGFWDTRLKPWTDIPLKQVKDSFDLCKDVYIEEKRGKTTFCKVGYNRKDSTTVVTEMYTEFYYKIYCLIVPEVDAKRQHKTPVKLFFLQKSNPGLFDDENSFKLVEAPLGIGSSVDFSKVNNGRLKYTDTFENLSDAWDAAQRLVYAIQKGLVELEMY